MNIIEDNTIKTDMDFVECVIIGTCSSESFAFQKIAHILNEKNFYLPFNKVIWKGMETLYPTTPIDAITIIQECKDKVNWFGGLAHHIMTCQSLVNSSANLPFHAIILLENRLKDAFKILLQSFSKTDSLLKMEILGEISNDLKSGGDIFELITISEAYARSKDWEELAEAIHSLNHNINERISNVRKTAQMDMLISNLINAYQIQPKHGNTIKILSSAIASLAIKGEFPHGFKKEFDHQLTAYTL